MAYEDYYERIVPDGYLLEKRKNLEKDPVATGTEKGQKNEKKDKTKTQRLVRDIENNS